MDNVDYIDSEGTQVLATGTLADQLRHTISQLRTENTQLKLENEDLRLKSVTIKRDANNNITEIIL